jgi:hypothetical protein
MNCPGVESAGPAANQETLAARYAAACRGRMVPR